MNLMPADQQPDTPAIESSPQAAIEPASVDTLEEASPLPPAEPQPKLTRGIAPIWHTLVLVLAVVAFSYWGADRGNPVDIDPIAPVPQVERSGPAARPAPTPKEKPAHTNSVRLIRYGLSAVVEVVFVGWIAFGVYLRKVPFRSLLGDLPRGLNNVTVEIGIAALFWLCSMVVLLAVAFTWQKVQDRVYQHELKQHQLKTNSAPQSQGQSSGKSNSPSESKGANLKSPKQQQAEMVRKLTELAPANGIEVAAWGLLCLLVGFSEEVIFRGYLQWQGIAFLRNVSVGLIFSALVFGAAHGYQGSRGICIITVYGSLFGILVLLRRNLLPGMIAHSWHDFATGMALALIRSSHLLDRLQSS